MAMRLSIQQWVCGKNVAALVQLPCGYTMHGSLEKVLVMLSLWASALMLV